MARLPTTVVPGGPSRGDDDAGAAGGVTGVTGGAGVSVGSANGGGSGIGAAGSGAAYVKANANINVEGPLIPSVFDESTGLSTSPRRCTQRALPRVRARGRLRCTLRTRAKPVPKVGQVEISRRGRPGAVGERIDDDEMWFRLQMGRTGPMFTSVRGLGKIRRSEVAEAGSTKI